MDFELSVLFGVLGALISILDNPLSWTAPVHAALAIATTAYSLIKLYRCFLYPCFLSPLRHLPGPEDGHFFIGHVARQLMTPGPIDIYLEWMRKWPNEPLIRHHLIANAEALLVNSTAALKEIQVTKAYSFCKPGIARRMFSPITGIGVMFAEGDVHKHQRAQLARPFSLGNVKKMLPIFQAKADELCGILSRDMSSCATHEIEIEPWFRKASLDILAIASIGYDLQSLSTPYASFYEVYNRIIHQPRLGHILTFIDGHIPIRSWLPLPSNRKWLQDNRLIKEMLVDKMQAQRRVVFGDQTVPRPKNQTGGRDLLSFILEDCQLHPDQVNWTDFELLEFLLNFMAGGHETVGTALMWASYVLSTQADIQEKLYKEVSSLFATRGSDWMPGFSDIESLVYLDHFIKEVLRVYSPALFLPREAAEDVTICGTLIPKGTAIILCPAVTHFHTKIWGPDADKFDPDRWSNRRFGHPSSDQYAFAAFLHGPKGCIGRSFAMLAMKVTVMEMVRRFRFVPRRGEEERVLEFANPNFTLRPKNDLRVLVEMR